ncbi:hypothetical protein J6T66_04360 [bacterium]|nr:hypothetical protein [bacterium]
MSEKLLPSGTYKFEVTMLDRNNNTILNESSNFTIVIPSELEILSPSE